MQALLPRLKRDDDGSHLVEYTLLALGVSTALVKPSLVIETLSSLANTIRLMASQLLMLF